MEILAQRVDDPTKRAEVVDVVVQHEGVLICQRMRKGSFSLRHAKHIGKRGQVSLQQKTMNLSKVNFAIQ